jgi:2-methylcitrate dehydratase PrpD
MQVTRTLARFVAECRPESVPDAMRHQAKRALLNVLGCAVGAARHETVERAVSALVPFFGKGEATLWGRTERADAPHAALLNGLSAHVLDFDDTHPHAIHPSAPVWPAILAAGEHRGASGAAMLHAFVLGAEVELRVGNMVYPAHSDTGWHATGTLGVFGAAAACGKLLGLDEGRLTHALGIAATQASGLRAVFGSDSKSLHAGKAARDGLAAALLAERGFTSSLEGIEARRGFAHVLSSARDYAAGLDGLGSRWELAQNMYKPFACGLVVHAVIDACIQARDAHHLVPEAIARVHARCNPIVFELTANREPRTGLEGKFSVFHAAAAALVHGAALEAQFSDACVLDPTVIALRRRVDAEPDPTVAKMEAYVAIELTDGRRIEHHVPHALGSVERPMADSDIEKKARALGTGVLPAGQIDALVSACWAAEELPDARSLTCHLSPPANRPAG